MGGSFKWDREKSKILASQKFDTEEESCGNCSNLQLADSADQRFTRTTCGDVTEERCAGIAKNHVC